MNNDVTMQKRDHMNSYTFLRGCGQDIIYAVFSGKRRSAPLHRKHFFFY